MFPQLLTYAATFATVIQLAILIQLARTVDPRSAVEYLFRS